MKTIIGRSSSLTLFAVGGGRRRRTTTTAKTLSSWANRHLLPVRLYCSVDANIRRRRRSITNPTNTTTTENIRITTNITDRQRRSYTSVILSNVYPDVSASAACVRTNYIVHGLANLSRSDEDDFDIDGDGDGDDRNNNELNKNKIIKNRVYYATSVNFHNNNNKSNNTYNNINPFETSSSGQGGAATDDTIQMVHLPPNRSDLFEKFVSTVTMTGNSDNDKDNDNDNNNTSSTSNTMSTIDIIIFDRFFMEEAHSYKFRQKFPNALFVLDMQDMHSLRWGRQKIVDRWDKNQMNRNRNKNKNNKNDEDDPFDCIPAVLDYLPSVYNNDNDDNDIDNNNDNDDRLIRELASIHRSDLVLVCSSQELYWLQNVYNIPKEKLCLASFFVDDDDGDDGVDGVDGVDTRITTTTTESSSSDTSNNNYNTDTPATRTRFVFCGGFKHLPNIDAVNILIDYIWPKIKLKLPDATLHIYGAFCPIHLINKYKYHDNKNTKKKKNKNNSSSKMNNDTTGIYVHGYEPDLNEIFGGDNNSNEEEKRILLAPLRYGAGIKGKIVDAWTYNMPVVTTPIGSEGMTIEVVKSTSMTTTTIAKEKEEISSLLFGGSIASTTDDFVRYAIHLSKNHKAYNEAQINGRFILKKLFPATTNWDHVKKKLLEVLPNDSSNDDDHGHGVNDCTNKGISLLSQRRQKDHIQAILWHQSMRSTEYFSRWIELKENSISGDDAVAVPPGLVDDKKE